jgi:divalent metal cation (Fe/Co/Zn/Cd) transporter
VTAPTTAVGTGLVPAADRVRLGRQARWLAWATIAYNTAEGLVAITAGALAGSVALVSFGLDSAVEVASAVVIAWQFSRPRPEQSERAALRAIAVTFLALAAYVTLDAVTTLTGIRGQARPSPVGIGLTAASLLVMPALAAAKRRVGRRLHSATVLADSTQTLLCTYLSAIVLTGLMLNATAGWTWADPLAALAVAGIAVREGIHAWHGDPCCDTPTPGTVPPASTHPNADCGSHDCCSAPGAAVDGATGSDQPTT